MLDLHRLRLLRELKHRGTLTAVAAALSYSPSTISQQLSQLEREVGVPLLQPDGRRVRLTAQAEILVGHTEAILHQLEAAESDIARSLTTLTGTVRVAAFQTATLALVPGMLTFLRDGHPELRVELVQLDSETALRALLNHDFDLAVGEEYPGQSVSRPGELERRELRTDRMRLAPPVGDSRGPTVLSQLADHPWVMEPAGYASRSWSVELCRLAGFEPDIRYETSDILVHLRLVELGHAAAVLPDLIWFDRSPTVPLHDIPLGAPSRRVFTATRHGNSRHPAITACRDALEQAAQSINPRLT